MRRKLLATGLSVVLCMLLLAMPLVTLAQGGGEGQEQEYIVKTGDNLYNIGLQFGVSSQAIAARNNLQNPRLIYPGQLLIIPAPTTVPPVVTETATATETPTETPTSAATPEPGEEVVHIVAQGENLFRIAEQYDVTVGAIVTANNITQPNLIVPGQRLVIPTGSVTTPPVTATADPSTTTETATPEATTATPTVAATATETATPEATTATPTETATETEAPTETAVATETETPVVQDATTETPTPQAEIPNIEYGFGFGIEVSLPGLDAASVSEDVTALGVSWVKHTVDWSRYEANQGQIEFDELDFIVDTLEGTGANIMLTVTGAPAWSRGGLETFGPPTDYETYASFVGALASRYGTRVAAYEIWDQPNLLANWNGKNLTGGEYMSLLSAAYNAIKAANSDVAVISAGLAPTGGDGVNAINDRAFLRQMYAAGLADVSDGVGAHPFGFANPPDSTCCESNPEITTHDDHPSFFFLDTLREYRDIMREAGDTAAFIWVTEFGWGTVESYQIEPLPGFEFVSNVSVDQQAQYLERAFTVGNSEEYVGPMFAWNMNFCQVVQLDGYECYWSMLNPVGDPLPVFSVMADITK